MKEDVYVGILVNTHALKGEVRIISDFEYKDRVFKIGNTLIIDSKEYTINTYRRHKNYDMVTFEGIDSINEANTLKGKRVYIKKIDLNLDEKEYLDSDLIGLEVIYEDKTIGKIDNIEINSGRKLFVINASLIPYNDNFIENINLKERKIILKNLNGLL